MAFTDNQVRFTYGEVRSETDSS